VNREPASFPAPEEGLRLHLRLGDLDPVAPADACRAYLPALLGWLCGKYPSVDPHLRQSAAHDALLGYFLRPQSYDPHRGDLGTYLRVTARSDLWNLFRSEGRHYRRRVAWPVVELGQESGYLSGGADDPAAQAERQEEAEQWTAFWRDLQGRLSGEERRVLDLMLAGERRATAFAEAAGLSHLPPEEQRREVKRVKDRIKKRLEREGLKHA
jgi:RNA polymerase sigma-70 factor (ECF subfamily)